MTVKQFLIKVRGLINKGWWKGFSSACDKKGMCCNWFDKRAVRFCLKGAFWKVDCDTDLSENGKKAEALLCRVISKRSRMKNIKSDGLIGYNEYKGRTKAQVLSVLDKAIEIA